MIVAKYLANNHDFNDSHISFDEASMPNDPQNNPEHGESEQPDIPAIPAGNISDRMPKIVPFEQLARCGDEIWIECNGQIYRLRRTRQGKLILTK
jgi:hemin uptake protein HemP